MARFRRLISRSDSNDLSEYERMVAVAKRAGFNAVNCGSIAEITAEQHYDPKDPWLAFIIINSGMMKFVETEVINGIFSRETLEKNARLLGEKSAILARHDMKGTLYLLEPQILPESFYREHPELRGPACYNPCLALSRYYSPCLDRPEILAHYREATRKMLEIAPEVDSLSIWTNDSGAGICWCSGLYPGPNGPEDCREVPMGDRIRKWMQAILAGAADAGREIEVYFWPVHFGRDEILNMIARLPRGAYPMFHVGEWAANDPFLPPATAEYVAEAKRRKRPAMLSLACALSGAMSPLTEPPVPYFVFDSLREAAGNGARGIQVRGLRPPTEGLDAVSTMALAEALARPPRHGVGLDRKIAAIARAHGGKRLAPYLVSAWRDIDHAVRLWPHIADTNHLLLMFYSVLGSRWLTRPIVPAPERLTEEEKQNYIGRNPEITDSFIWSEGTRNYNIDEMKWPVAFLDHLMSYADRAVATMDTAAAKLEREDDATRKRFMRQYRHLAMLRAFWRNQRNVLRCATIIEFFTGEKSEDYWHVIRKDESFLEPGTYRRLFLEAMDDEIENARQIIRLMNESDVPLVRTGAEASTYMFADNLAELLENKIAVMAAHKDDIDILFPDCPEETFTDPTYEWADRTSPGEGQPECP